MKFPVIIILLMFSTGFTEGQDIDTLTLRYAASKDDTILYKRTIEFDKSRNLFHVRDYFENGQIQMDGIYSSIDKNVKEEYQCNYRTNTKEGPYKEWYENGQVKYSGYYEKGLRNGPSSLWYVNGKTEAEENWLHGQLHGRVKYWDKYGDLVFESHFISGINQKPRNVAYPYLSYTPKDYDADTLKKWPIIIFLHGGSRRGKDLRMLYADGIPDQIYRGRDFPFVIAAPQCPEHLRWSTDNWFENFYEEVTNRFRIDTNRIYLTGLSLGGSGTWYLAVKYPDKFAAIAPMCGFTSHLDYIDKNIDRLTDIPIWAFHGKIDNVVPFEETEGIIKKLKGKNDNVIFSAKPDVGHWIQWLTYPKQELYDWFLKFDKRLNKH